MSHRADPRLLATLREYGALTIESCFNCGNCTAVCPLSAGEDQFPRRMIRYGQLGMRDALLASKELWLCYACGECTATCPRQADPGGFMAAARRYAIASYDPLGLARLFLTSVRFSAAFLVLMAALAGFVAYSLHGPMAQDSLRLFDFIPAHAIHDAGIVAGFIVILLLAAGGMHMLLRVGRATGLPHLFKLRWFSALLMTVRDIFAHRRYRADCVTTADTQPWYLRTWFTHASMMWGFMGLFLATALDYALSLAGLKPTGTWVPVWQPVRLLGTLAGILFIYGVTTVIIRRLFNTDRPAGGSTPPDWSFLILLWLTGMTGFALELALYLPQPYAWSYWMLPAHLVFVAELFILLPFTTFAHVLYRPAALYIHILKSLPHSEPAPAGSSE